MTTQREYALANKITPQMEQAASYEKVPVQQILKGLRSGKIALVKNSKRDIRPMAVGAGMFTKVNANIGTSQLKSTLKAEIAKLKACTKYGADAVMDLSTGGDLDKTRKNLLAKTKLAFGTVPIYQLMCDSHGELDGDTMLNIIRKHCEQGVDFITVHCGVTREVAKILQRYPRVTGVVSRGGSYINKWLNRTGKENPLYERFDELCEIAREYDVTLSLGDGLRPGCLADAHDRAQIKELAILGKLTKRAWRKGVQVMIEGPGHVPYNQIVKSMRLEKKLCHGAPFYVLGPLTTDIGAGYDHITGAIGGTLAAVNGADFLCYVTPAEHLGLPDLQDVRDGIMASRIAAHSADIVKYPARVAGHDLAMALARKALNWDKQIELALDSDKARAVRKAKGQKNKTCTMCGELCSMKDN